MFTEQRPKVFQRQLNTLNADRRSSQKLNKLTNIQGAFQNVEIFNKKLFLPRKIKL